LSSRGDLQCGCLNNLGADLIQRQNFVCQTVAGYEPWHTPNHAAGFILHLDAGSCGAHCFATLQTILPMPVGTTASARAPNTEAIEWKSTSTDGRQKFSFGP
jgi:hypothetical protein